MSSLVSLIRPGDRVTISTAHGGKVTGKAQALLCFPDHCVINIGGRYGRPMVANDSNIISVAKGKHK